jgi:hypothetical protein
MSRLRFSFSKSLVTTTALAFISASCLSSVAFSIPDEEKSCVALTASSPKDLLDADSLHKDFFSSNPTIINPILGHLDHQSLLSMGKTNRHFHKIYNSPDLWDVLFQRDLYPSISLTSLHLKSPSSYYELAHVLQEVLLPSAIRLGDDFEMPDMRALEDMVSKAFPEHSPQGNYLRGFIYEAFDLGQEAFDAYKKAADLGNKKAQALVNTALYEGKLGQGRRSGKKRFVELQARAAEGDQSAQKLRNKALYYGALGQDARPQKKRFNELKLLAVMGDQDAQILVNTALYEGKLGQRKRPKQERFEELQARAAEGDQSARKLRNMALYYGKLGQSNRPQQERFEELKTHAAGGDQDAQERVSGALYNGTLGQGSRPEQERFAELQAAASEGIQDAQRQVNFVLYHGELGQDARPKQERFEELILNVKKNTSNILKYNPTYTHVDSIPWVLRTFILPLLESLREGK